jgi:hypothetical protein
MRSSATLSSSCEVGPNLASLFREIQIPGVRGGVAAYRGSGNRGTEISLE